MDCTKGHDPLASKVALPEEPGVRGLMSSSCLLDQSPLPGWQHAAECQRPPEVMKCNPWWWVFVHLGAKVRHGEMEDASIQHHSSRRQCRQYWIQKPQHKGQLHQKSSRGDKLICSHSWLILVLTADLAHEPLLGPLHVRGGSQEAEDGT